MTVKPFAFREMLAVRELATVLMCVKDRISMIDEAHGYVSYSNDPAGDLRDWFLGNEGVKDRMKKYADAALVDESIVKEDVIEAWDHTNLELSNPVRKSPIEISAEQIKYIEKMKGSP